MPLTASPQRKLTSATKPHDNGQPYERPQIILQTFQKGDRIVIQIMNNGPPISNKVSQQMFDPFFTTKPIGQGTGMGLAICYQTVVGLHKGLLDYTKTAEQKTAFTIELPIAQVTRP